MSIDSMKTQRLLSNIAGLETFLEPIGVQLTGGPGLFRHIRDLPASEPEMSEAERRIWNEFGRECAVLVLDSSGFTRNTRDSGIINYLSCIVRLRDILREVFEDAGCISCRFSTDNAFAEFYTAPEALKAAYRAQKAVRDAGIDICSGCRMEVCIGIGYGRVLLSGNEGVFGDQMNLASKLGEDVAGKGEVLLTESAYLALPESAREGFHRYSVTISDVDITFYRMDLYCPSQ